MGKEKEKRRRQRTRATNKENRQNKDSKRHRRKIQHRGNQDGGNMGNNKQIQKKEGTRTR